MKFSFVLSALATLAVAVETSPRSVRKRSITVEKFDGDFTPRAANKPASAPAGYESTLIVAGRKRSLPALEVVPDNIKRRTESLNILRRLQVRQQASDFYECRGANPPPVASDCRVIVDSVSSSGDDLVVAQNSCLVFGFGTCQGFFCSLCETLATSTDFIGSQLDLVEALCVANSQAGTIIGESAPQYSVGFVRSGAALPSYDVC